MLKIRTENEAILLGKMAYGPKHFCPECKKPAKREAGFLVSNKLEDLEFKLEKILGFRNMQEKLKNNVSSCKNYYKKCLEI